MFLFGHLKPLPFRSSLIHWFYRCLCFWLCYLLLCRKKDWPACESIHNP
uniref:Uncharacterized protein n=1 Tax=Picea sitchensis TaxID=3332 RepID=A0A6B9XWM9_PICSI|nr:hypothetical protein Q903MT_gene5511 [Picea sitchensis]